MRADRVSRAGKGLLIGFGASLALTACTAGSVQNGNSIAAGASTASPAQQPGAVRTGLQTESMSAQYSTPRKGAVAAAGASAWVPPAPPAAFTVTDLPPPAPPAGGANGPRSAPAPQPDADASQLVRPEAAAPEAAPAPAAGSAPALNAATLEQGRMLFASSSCGSCHALADAGSSGGIGPGFDGNRNLTRDYVIDTVKTGRGAMPSFAGQLTDEEIGTLADYIIGAARK